MLAPGLVARPAAHARALGEAALDALSAACAAFVLAAAVRAPALLARAASPAPLRSGAYVEAVRSLADWACVPPAALCVLLPWRLRALRGVLGADDEAYYESRLRVLRTSRERARAHAPDMHLPMCGSRCTHACTHARACVRRYALQLRAVIGRVHIRVRRRVR